MIEKEFFTIIEKEARAFLQKLGVEGSVAVEEKEESSVLVSITTPSPKELIGEQGKVLADLEYVLKVFLRKRVPEQRFYVCLDVNNYKKSKEHYIREIARNVADEVALLKKEKEFPPMSPAERRIIHTELGERADIVSESIGEGKTRRVIIKPAL